MKSKQLKTLGLCFIILSGMASSITHAARDNNERRDKNQERNENGDRKVYRNERKSNNEHNENRNERKNHYERKEARQERRDDKKYDHNKNYHQDRRYQHDRYYPRRGISISILPSRHHTIRYRNSNYYYSSGIWYRPFGATFTVVAPPFGLIVPILPPFYSTVWFHSTPYYYANDVYYVWRPGLNGYQVTEPPEEIVQGTPQIDAEELIIYPKQGQNEKKQADDRYECHSWGKSQTQYDPTKPPENMPVSELNQKRSNYQRAMRACLEGRGYSVR